MGDPVYLLTTAEAAEILQRSPAYLANLRCLGKGPPFWRKNGRVFYAYRDLAQYAAPQRSDPANQVSA